MVNQPEAASRVKTLVVSLPVLAMQCQRSNGTNTTTTTVGARLTNLRILLAFGDPPVPNTLAPLRLFLCPRVETKAVGLVVARIKWARALSALDVAVRASVIAVSTAPGTVKVRTSRCLVTVRIRAREKSG